MHYISNFFIALAFVGVLTSCTGGNAGLTSSEKELITSQAGRTMRLFTVESTEDSLLLRKVSRDLSLDDLRSDEYRMLKEGMLLTVNDSLNRGVGIAAPQVGVSCRLIAVERVDKIDHPFETYANPRIIYRSQETHLGREGCLSIPDRRGYVDRADTIVIEYVDDIDLTTTTQTVSGFAAVIFQHEIDHLDGILYTDKMSQEMYVDKFAKEHPEYLPGISIAAVAPDFEAKAYDGSKLRLSDYSDKIVVIDFWASWCGDCRREMDEIKQLQAEYSEKNILGCDVQFIGYSFDRDESAWRNYIDDEGVSWPQVCTFEHKWHEMKVTSDYGLHWIPGFVIVSPHSQRVIGRAITAKGLRQALIDISLMRINTVK